MAKGKTTPIKMEIRPPNFQSVSIRLEGTSPLMTHKFSEKMRRMMEDKQTNPDQTKAKREPKDYEAEYEAARYVAKAGWDGVPCAAIRNAMIEACRYVSGLAMKNAKGMWFIEADGADADGTTPLCRIQGKPKHDTRPVRLESGVADLRNRPRYDDWAIEVTVQYDADVLTPSDIGNLLARAGTQVGLCEYRPAGKRGNGGDYGCFTVKQSKARRLKAVA